jgi:4-hydroxybenzoate polyprenyltransferase
MKVNNRAANLAEVLPYLPLIIFNYEMVKGIWQFVKLTRPENLVMVIVTMVLLRYFVVLPLLTSSHLGLSFSMSTGWFAVNVLVVVLVTAAGNIINDYFDQKVDRINKPDRLIVGKTVKRRQAIVLHHALNVLAVGLCLLLCKEMKLLWPLGIPITIASLLWIYSPLLKTKPFIGNFIVATCVAVVPMWTGIFELRAIELEFGDMMQTMPDVFQRIYRWLALFAIFAFLLTLVREMAKDLEDLEGDKEEQYQTLAIIWPLKRSRIYMLALEVFTLVLVLSLGVVEFSALENKRSLLFALLWCILLPMARVMYQTAKAQTKEDFRAVSRSLKLTMLCGVLASVFLATALEAQM